MRNLVAMSQRCVQICILKQRLAQLLLAMRELAPKTAHLTGRMPFAQHHLVRWHPLIAIQMDLTQVALVVREGAKLTPLATRACLI